MTEKYKLQQEDINSMDLNGDTFAKLKQILPEVFAEGADGNPSIDVERLKIALGGAVDVESDNKSRFSFGWSGKKQAQALANQPSTATLRPSIEDSKMWDSTQNVYIEGDNLEVLKLLQKSYYGSIKMIYIDPPYNTGKDFVYKDNFHDNVKNYLQLTGQVDDEGNKISTNTDKSGRYHTDWLNMMYPRLKLARNLLKDDGVIFISIDDNEVHNLRKICDEIFGEDNFIGCAGRISKKASNQGEFWSNNFDYLLTYCKNRDACSPFFGGINYNAYNLIDNEGERQGEKYQLIRLYMTSLDPMRGCSNQRYFIQCPDGSFVIPPGESFPEKIENGGSIAPKTSKDKVWRWSLNTYLENKNKIVIKKALSSNLVNSNGEETKWNVYTKTYLNDVIEKSTAKPNNFIENHINQSASHELNLIEIPFDFAKPSSLIKFLAETCCVDKSDIILDFFSGSATTAHAVMQLNAEDGGNRKYICVQLPEATTPESEAYKAGYKNICEIGKERIRRAGEKVFAEWTEKQQKSAQASADAGLFTDDAENNTAQTSLDIGFKVFKLDTSNLKPFDSVDMFADDLLVTNRSALDLFYELVLKQGYSLDNHQCVLDIGGTRCYALVHEDNTPFVLAVLDDTVKPNFALELLKYALTLVIVKDACFGTDEIKLNLLATLEQLQSKDNPLQIRII